MVNEIRTDEQGLVAVDYTDLLDKIITVLHNQNTENPFKLVGEGKRLMIELHSIAQLVASASIDNPLGNKTKAAKVATVNFSGESREQFAEKIQQIREQLTPYLSRAISEQDQELTLEKWVNSLTTELIKFEGNFNKNITLNYPFREEISELQKTELSFQRGNSTRPQLKFHKLKITVEDGHQFREQLKRSLENYIKFQFSEEEEQRDLLDILEDLETYQTSDLDRLEELLDQEALGKLQREAKVIYLEYLKEQIGEHQDLIYLEDLIRRLRLMEAYINDEEKEDGHYEVNYEGITVKYRDLFSRADAFDMLPIWSIIEGCIGETEDEKNDKQQFIFGLKLKLNGSVNNNGGKEVFPYYLDFLDPDSNKYKEELEKTSKKEYFVEKVLKVAFLYYFVFAGNDLSNSNIDPKVELEYDPIANFEEKVLPILQGDDQPAKYKILKGIKRGLEQYKANHKISKLENLLKTFIQRKHNLPARNYPRHLNVKQGILQRDYESINNNNSFFHTLQENRKSALKYISITNPNAGNNSLSTLAVNINISEVCYFPTGTKEQFEMKYHFGKVPTLPILLTPKEKKCLEAYHTGLNQSQKFQGLIFSYDVKQLKQATLEETSISKRYFYKVTFSLLVYVTLKILLDLAAKPFFVPVIRFHLGSRQNPYPEEKFLKSVFSSVSHLLNEKHRCHTQGFRVKNINMYRVGNGLASLYSILPKKFTFTNPRSDYQLDKLALIIVSSRESDRARDQSINYRISNLVGESIAFQRQADQSIRIYSSGTFSDNYGNQQIYSSPSVVIDRVNDLYEQGFRHFLYLAKSPYSSTLKLTQTEEDEERFFMSKAVIRSLKGDKEDIKIYPIFFDQYYALNLDRDQAKSSLYIQDTSQLSSLTEDPSKKTIVFLNLFNGIKVGNDRYYNGVISYATLLDIYENILDDEDIRNGLIDDTPLKNEILEFLTLFHFSRYESPKNISLKLDPYQNLIGDESIGALSVFDHLGENVKFNSLAFLTEVKKALNVPPESNL